MFGEDPQLVAAAVGTVLPLAIVAPAEVLRCLVTEAVQDASKARPGACYCIYQRDMPTMGLLNPPGLRSSHQVSFSWTVLEGVW